jgi:hypothetical protein
VSNPAVVPAARAKVSTTGIAPRAIPSVDVRNVGNRLVANSWPASLNNDADPTPNTPGVNHRRRAPA